MWNCDVRGRIFAVNFRKISRDSTLKCDNKFFSWNESPALSLKCVFIISAQKPYRGSLICIWNEYVSGAIRSLLLPSCLFSYFARDEIRKSYAKNRLAIKSAPCIGYISISKGINNDDISSGRQWTFMGISWITGISMIASGRLSDCVSFESFDRQN